MDTTGIRRNEWVAAILSILPGMGHLYLAGYFDKEHNFEHGIKLLTGSVICFGILTEPVVYIVYIGFVIYAACNAYSRGRSREGGVIF